MGEAGSKAWWLTVVSGAILAIVSAVGARWVGGISRRTEIDKMYMQELQNVRLHLSAKERECDEKDTEIDVLRRQHLEDAPCFEREKALVVRVEELTRRVGELTDRLIQRNVRNKREEETR